MAAEENRARILIVDDEPQMRFYLMTLVKSMGFEPILARDGVQGLDALKKVKPSAIILDIMMPNKGGARFYQDYLKDPSYRDIPVVFFSGVDRNAFFHYIKMLNITDEAHIPEPKHYVPKDADPEYLKSVVTDSMKK